MELNKLYTNNFTGNIKHSDLVAFGNNIYPFYLQPKDSFVRQSTSTSPITTPNLNVEHLISPEEVVGIINKYVNTDIIQRAVENNQNITYVLNSFGLQPVISEKNIDKSLKYHLASTAAFAMEIAKREHLSVHDTNTLIMASALHDVGKSLIPEAILQKPDQLTPQEREIVDLHSFLSSEILKTCGVSKEVIELVSNHHNPEKTATNNSLVTILTISDIFSALKEKRSYKDAFTDAQAFSYLYQRTSLDHRYIRHLELSRSNY